MGHGGILLIDLVPHHGVQCLFMKRGGGLKGPSKVRSGDCGRAGSYRRPVEHLVRAVLKDSAISPGTIGREQELAREVLSFDTSKTRVVVLGGGTGLFIAPTRGMRIKRSPAIYLCPQKAMSCFIAMQEIVTLMTC